MKLHSFQLLTTLVAPIVLTLLMFMNSCEVGAFTVEVEPSEKLCFHEVMRKGERLLIGYQVQDGPEYEIDFDVENSRGAVIDKQVDSMGYEKSYDADSDGRITYCFHNTDSAYPAKWVSFYMFKDDVEAVSKSTSSSSTDPLELELSHLKEAIRSLKEEQQYVINREKVHRNTAESTNSRVMWWSLLQLVLVIGTCFWQVAYIKKFFSK